MENNVKTQKCTCVPSGRCHSHMLLGCPHKHYFNKDNKWTCDLPSKPFFTANEAYCWVSSNASF